MNGYGPQNGVPVGVEIISMPAEITYKNAHDVTVVVLAAVVLPTTAIVVDLTHTAHWDAAGIREVVHAYGLARSMGVDFRVVMSPNPVVSRRWTMRGLDQLIGSYPSIAAAIEGSRQSA
jgi:anti-anti-sigma factor